MKKIVYLILVLLLTGCQNKPIPKEQEIIISKTAEALISHVDANNTIIQIIQPEELDEYWKFLKDNKILIPTKFFNGIEVERIKKAYILQDEQGNIMSSHQFYQEEDPTFYLEMQVHYNAKQHFFSKLQIKKINEYEVRYKIIKDTHQLHSTAIEFMMGNHNVVFKASYFNGKEVKKDETHPKKYTPEMFYEIIQSLALLP